MITILSKLSVEIMKLFHRKGKCEGWLVIALFYIQVEWGGGVEKTGGGGLANQNPA